jgi:cell division septal protein FtsQ
MPYRKAKNRRFAAKKTIKKKIKRLFVSFLSFAAVMGIFYFAFFSDYFQLKEVTISGNSKISSDKITRMIEAASSKKIALLSTKSVFLFGKNKIASLLKSSYPEIKNVYVKIRFPDVVEAQIEERQPIATLIKEGELFSIDQEGIIFEKTNKVFGPLIRSDQSSAIKLGEEVVEQKLLAGILGMESSFKKMNVKIKEYLICFSCFKITATSQDGWEAYFDTKKDLGAQVSDMEAVFNQEIGLGNLKNLKYIDLRFIDKVYYRMNS